MAHSTRITGMRSEAHCKDLDSHATGITVPHHDADRKPLAEHEPDGQTAIKKGAAKGANDLHDVEQFNPV
ncbi:hypothetical protein PHLCEN_2v9700 [Hermanssonia centrifuga]|uniref:Uncharacterized protein n=1 Tax=Hermanssonia centrifuga TaxID=98765 RepID=A0A2R6NQ42_9APHY|nr:hypothetical protein PHLCEN_2v9700 [Hermanssonia centrifuga]